jgi:hypothetical protein
MSDNESYLFQSPVLGHRSIIITQPKWSATIEKLSASLAPITDIVVGLQIVTRQSSFSVMSRGLYSANVYYKIKRGLHAKEIQDKVVKQSNNRIKLKKKKDKDVFIFLFLLLMHHFCCSLP